MKILVLGSGGREHALAWRLSTSPGIEVFAGPGNAGTTDCAVNLPTVSLADFDTAVEAVRKNRIDIVLVGPEVPLAAGIADHLSAQGIPVVGPKAGPARLESSKTFSKAFMVRNGIPTAEAVELKDHSSFVRHIRANAGKRLVVKKSGLAAGKGVLESSRTEELEAFGTSILSGDTLLVEEFLEGWEVSIFGLSDGISHIVPPPCTDFKKAHDGDTGPNTGGMGSICPVPWVDQALSARIAREVVEPTYQALAREGLSYAGVLYFGLMITKTGPKVLEFNVRFGDPETQVLMPMLDMDFGKVVEAMAGGTLAGFAAAPVKAPSATRAALGIVVASRGYPESSHKGAAVEIGPSRDDGLTHIFHASTSHDAEGVVRTGGGRCFTAVGMGADLKEASERALEAADRIRFEGAWHRTDIGRKFFGGRQ